jgi:hypothetical protein
MNWQLSPREIKKYIGVLEDKWSSPLKRKNAADRLGDVEVSNEKIVSALLRASQEDDSKEVRETARLVLSFSVHQSYLDQQREQENRKQAVGTIGIVLASVLAVTIVGLFLWQFIHTYRLREDRLVRLEAGRSNRVGHWVAKAVDPRESVEISFDVVDGGTRVVNFYAGIIYCAQADGSVFSITIDTIYPPIVIEEKDYSQWFVHEPDDAASFRVTNSNITINSSSIKIGRFSSIEFSGLFTLDGQTLRGQAQVYNNGVGCVAQWTANRK